MNSKERPSLGSKGSRGPWGLAVLLLLPFLLGASSDKWHQLAEHDLIFTKGLASDGVRFGPRFMDDVIAGNVFEFGCNVRPSKLAVLDPTRVRQIQLYSEHHCNPWHEVLSRLAWPCEGGTVPQWCKGNSELLAKHLKVDPYFEALTDSIRRTEDGLERYNLMAVMVERLGDKFLNDYPKDVLETWAKRAASVFLEKAQPAEALGIAWLFSRSLDDNASLARLFEKYQEHTPNTSADDRRLLKEVAESLHGRAVTEATRSLLADRFGPKDPVAAPHVPDRTNPADISLLVKRVGMYYGLLRDKEYAESWSLMVLYYREEDTQQSYVDTTRTVEHGREVLGWRLSRIYVSGDTANIFVDVRRNHRSSPAGSKEKVQEEESFWSFESGNWYKQIPWPEGWESRKVVEVPVPQSPDGQGKSF